MPSQAPGSTLSSGSLVRILCVTIISSAGKTAGTFSAKRLCYRIIILFLGNPGLPIKKQNLRKTRRPDFNRSFHWLAQPRRSKSLMRGQKASSIRSLPHRN